MSPRCIALLRAKRQKMAVLPTWFGQAYSFSFLNVLPWFQVSQKLERLMNEDLDLWLMDAEVS